MARLRIPFTGLFVLLTLGLGLLPGGARTAAAQVPKPAQPVAPFPGADSAAARWVSYVGHIGGPTQAVAVEGNLAYVGEGPGLTMLDVSVPASPTVLGRTEPLPGLVYGVVVVGGYAYVADYDAGLFILHFAPTGRVYLPLALR
jgi:hypothetical protein